MPRRRGRKAKGIGGFLLNAHIPKHTEEYLIQKNYRVERPPRGMADHAIFQLAKRKRMVLITQDKEMRKHVSSSRHQGVVIILGSSRRLGSERVTSFVDDVLSFKPIEDLAGQIIEISQSKMEITPGDIQ